MCLCFDGEACIGIQNTSSVLLAYYAACFVFVLPKLRKSDGTQEAQPETHLMQAREGMTSCTTILGPIYLQHSDYTLTR